MASVKCSIAFGKPVGGLILHKGFALEHKGKDAITSLDQNLFYEENSGAVMLAPDLELKSMGGTPGAFTDGDGEAITTNGGTWILTTMPGEPELKMLHQIDTTETSWQIAGTPGGFWDNQGFVFYWSKFATPDGSDPRFYINLGDDLFRYIIIDFYPREKVIIKHVDNYAGITKTWQRELPASFLPTDTPMNFMVCLFVDNYIILGFNGLTNALALKCEKYDTITDQTGIPYPQIYGAKQTVSLVNGNYLKITGAGAGVFGFKRLTFQTEGDLISPWLMPGCNPSASTVAKITKYIRPLATSITGAFANNKPVEIEGTAGSGTQTGRFRYGLTFRGDGTFTPYVYSWRIKDPQTRASVSPSTLTLTGDVQEYTENITGNKDGSFGNWTTSLNINCYAAIGAGWPGGIYQTIFTSRNAQVGLNFNPGDGSTLRATHFVDAATVSRPEHNTINLTVESQSIVKRLRLTPILNAESFDDRGWRHGDLMDYLASLGGVTIHTSAYTTDPLLPSSQEKDRANWQFNPGCSIWEAMQMVREYSGWLLYPDSIGGLIYKPYPTTADAADWTLNMEDFEDVQYAVTDLARTRFLVIGQAGADDPTGRYQKGDGILSYKTSTTLETQLGESRPLFIVDPALGSIEMTDNMCSKLHDYYVAVHKIVLIKIPNFKTYKTMQLYQVLSITDPTVPDVNGKYLGIGLRITSSPFVMSAYLEAMSL